MLQIAQASSSGTARLQGGLRVAKDPNDPLAYLVRATLRFALGSAEDARAWEGTAADPVLPGLGALYEYATADTNTRKWKVAMVDDRELIVGLAPQRDTEAAGEGYEGGMVVRGVRASLTQKECVVDVALVAGGLTEDEQRAVVRLLRGLVEVQTENRQVELFDGQDGASASG